MTAPARRPSPHPTAHTRPTRRQLAADRDNLEQQRDRAIAAQRADRDRVAALLEGRAAAFDQDADHLDRLGGKSPLTALQRRAIADELRDIIRDIDTGGRVAE